MIEARILAPSPKGSYGGGRFGLGDFSSVVVMRVSCTRD